MAPTMQRPAVISAELPEAFDAGWNRIPGITVAGNRVTLDPAQYFFKLNDFSWLVIDWADAEGDMLDEVYHGGWFNETRRLELVRAHTALGGRLVHGCQSVPSQTGGAVVPYGASLERFRSELAAMKGEWIAAVEACRATN